MGRHNTVAGRMAESAAKKANLFAKLVREIMVAARAGGDINSNAALRAAVTKARDNSMPNDNIERAIKKGSGELTSVQYEECLYEGYGPGGIAVMVQVLTDNKNRTLPELRRIFQKNGGHMGESGAVAWMFKRKGIFIINIHKISEEKIMEIALEAGAEDIQTEEGYTTVYTEPTDFHQVREAFAAAGIPFEKTGIEFIPENRVDVSGENGKMAQDLIDRLEDHDDVQSVYHNFAGLEE